MTKTQYDAGTRHYDHYAATLPKWRYILRHAILPAIRIETPPLAGIQRLIRNPILDSYFAFAANLGTHTFFMVFLPILYWCGYPEFGRALVNLLAAGVIVSGIIKDVLCLPRPMSPPLQRITMSGSAALEYGFPSTHSTNAMSVALYAVHILNSDRWSTLSPAARQTWTWGFYVYAVSIAFGRLYCGMHGFIDVVCGCALGALLTSMQVQFGEPLYEWTAQGSFLHPLTVMVILLFVVRAHPEPADDCPCFDDSVAFSGVLGGIYGAYWHIQPHAPLRLMPMMINSKTADLPLGVPLNSWKTFVRIPLGVLIIVVYRSITKKLLFQALPPLFRVMEHLDLDLPRRYFLKASQYTTIPELRRDDNVLPSSSDVGQMLGDIRKRRGRAISIGPQSMADAREVLAYRQHTKRRERSISSSRGTTNTSRTRIDKPAEHKATNMVEMDKDASSNDLAATADEQEDEEIDRKEQRALFSAIPRIRVKYDAEVITKLIVYAGIGWWAVEGCNVVFEVLGVGVDRSTIP